MINGTVPQVERLSGTLAEENTLQGGLHAGETFIRGVSSIEQTTTSEEDGGINIVTSTLTDGTKTTFEIRNGKRGSKGDKGDKGDGASVTSENIKTALGYTPADPSSILTITKETWTFTLEDGSTVTKQVHIG